MSENRLTMASLFDGSGGFPLAAAISGIEPIWASEIEPFPIRVTTRRFPNMKHYGDVSKIDGAKVPPVDIITFGSPCQDLSVAGKRAGLEDGLRSNLFYQAVRIIKEMRKETHGKYPRWAIWENVPGAFSSNDGEDFKSVLETMINVKNEQQPISISRPNKWEDAGLILGRDYSVAWRVLDAQYWGVAQRRRRIFLIADFAGGSAGKILFESDGVSGYSSQGFRAWQRLANSAENGVGETSRDAVKLNVFVKTARATSSEEISKWEEKEVANTLNTFDRGDTRCNEMVVEGQPKTPYIDGWGGNMEKVFDDDVLNTIRVAQPQVVFENHTEDGSYCIDMGGGKSSVDVLEDKSPTLSTTHYGAPAVGTVEDTVGSLCARDFKGAGNQWLDENKLILEKDNQDAPIYCSSAETYMGICKNISPVLKARDYKDAPFVTVKEDKPLGLQMQSSAGIGGISEDKAQTLIIGDNPGWQNGVAEKPSDEPHYIVRRLTPTECARLQGFPDWWCSGLNTKHPTEEDIAFWTDVWKTWTGINGTPQKTRNSIISWLKHPYSDASEYKMWGNGVALPCVYFLMEGIAWANKLPIEEIKPVEKAGQLSIFDF